MGTKTKALLTAIAWTPDYRIGIDAIDQDHERLFTYFNELLRHLANDSSPEATHAAIDRLETIFKDHFDNEETVMQSIGFPGFEGHKAKHQTFLEMLRGLKAFHPGSQDFTDYFLRVFRNWIVYHITVNDREIGQFLATVAGRVGG